MKPFRTCLGGLVSAFSPLALKVGLSAVIGILQVCASLSFVWVSKRVVDIATAALDLPLAKYVTVFVSILVVQVILRVAASFWEGYLVVNTQNARRESMFSKVLTSTWHGKEVFHSADTVNRLEEDVRVTTDFLCVTVPDFFITIFQLAAASVFLCSMAPKLVWVLLVIMPMAALGSRLFFRKMRLLTNEIRVGDSLVQKHMQENLQHRILLKMLGCVDAVREKFGILQADVRGKTVTRLGYGALSRSILQLGFSSGYALVFLWGVYGLKEGTVSYGMMVAFLQLVGQVQRPVVNIVSQIPAFIRALSSEDRLLDLINQPQEARNGDIRLDGVPGVRISGLSFSYDGAGGRRISWPDFDFKPGTMTAVTGPTGAGKSTLIRVILSLLKPDSGRVVIYSSGEEYDSSADTRCNFMYVPQGNSLMSGTIRENLLMANPDASDGQIRDVLHVAASDFVFDLPCGLDTVCAEVGSGLSEGQAQRIAIARALLRPGGILVLDEATSALDADTELEMLQRLADRYHGKKTIICITHRPAATSFADSVLKVNP